MEIRLLVLVLLFLSHGARAQTDVIDLQFALFTSGPGGGFDSRGVVPAIEIAQEQILRNESILNGYNLSHAHIQETECNRTTSFNHFFQTVLFTNTSVLGLLGCGCSVASEPVAEVIHQWNIPQVSYASTNVMFDDKTKFVNFFRTIPSDDTLLLGIGTVLEYYGWTRVALITQMENIFLSALNGLVKQEMSRDVTLNITTDKMVSSSLQEVNSQVSDPNFFIGDYDIRVFFINVYEDVARIIICEAFKLNLTYPRYAWVTYGWYRDRWWSADVNNFPIDCSDDDLESFLEHTITILTYPTVRDANATTDTGLTANEFYDMYAARLNTTEAMNNNFTYTYTATSAYDATWVLAIALNKTVAMINSSEEEIYEETGCNNTNGLGIVPLENFTYDNEFMGCVIRSFVQQTNFNGVSGKVFFDKVGTRTETEITVMQYRPIAGQSEVQLIEYASVTGNGSLSYFSNESNSTVYPDGIPPDGTPQEKIVTFHLSLVLIYYVLAAAGLVFAAVCFVFNFAFRKRKVVRLTSPKLNYFIIAGGFILYVSIFIRIIPSESQMVNTITCNMKMFLNTVGYCLAFGTILAKMGRVYHIFHDPTEIKKTTLQDWKLALIIIGITIVGTVLAVLGVSVPQLRATASLVSTSENFLAPSETDLGVQINYMAFQCFSLTEETTVIIIITFVYFALLQIIGLVLAIQTRKVTVKVLNDSAYIAALIYISSISLVVFVLITFTLQAFVNIYETLFSGGVLLVATAFLALTFVPKMVSLYRDPNGEKIFDSTNTQDMSGATTAVLSIDYALRRDSNTSRVTELESKIAELEAELSVYRTQVRRRGSEVSKTYGSLGSQDDTNQETPEA